MVRRLIILATFIRFLLLGVPNIIVNQTLGVVYPRNGNGLTFQPQINTDNAVAWYGKSLGLEGLGHHREAQVSMDKAKKLGLKI